ncbi:hypothetical protein, partial [Flavobacterium sp.]|uniref:hypothetical protein n=1 Tax=Flavobacterium sp. TaxID=239 RepID=UPI0025BE6D1D
MSLRINYILLLLFISNNLWAQPSPVDSCVVPYTIRFRLFEGKKLIKKNNEQYVVHTSKPEAESAYQNCPWQADSVYAFMLALDNNINNPPYIISIIRKEDTMKVVIKKIYYDWFYIDSLPFMVGHYEITLPEDPLKFIDGKVFMHQLYKEGKYGWILTPASWDAIRVDKKKITRIKKQKN